MAFYMDCLQRIDIKDIENRGYIAAARLTEIGYVLEPKDGFGIMSGVGVCKYLTE